MRRRVQRDVTELRLRAAEQAALRRVAMVVAREASRGEVFAAVAEETGHLVGAQEIRILRFEDDESAVVVASWGESAIVFPIGRRLPLGGDNATTRVARTGRPTRIDDYAREATGPIAEAATPSGLRGIVATPIVVEGRLWGTMLAGTFGDPLPADTESRLGQFTELMAAAVANAESRDALARLAEEQAALRRVATLVASGTSPESVFRAVADEVAALLSCDTAAVVRFEADGTGTMLGTHSTRRLTGERFEFVPGYVLADVRASGQPARFDSDDPRAEGMPDPVRAEGIRSGLASPIVVAGELWGAITVASLHDPFPAGTEGRLTDFTDLVATAVSNALARGELGRLADEQAALRRVATLVAQGASPTAVFDAAAAELGALLGADGITVCRYEPGDAVTLMAHRGEEEAQLWPGMRVHVDADAVTAIVRRTRRAARVDSYAGTGGTVGKLVRRLGYRAGVGAPIVVEGRLWGATVASWTGNDPPPDAEERMAQFTELLDTAIANADSRDQLTASRVRLLTEADEARRRLVRDLHDGAQQRLVHTIVSLKLAREAIRRHSQDAESLVGEALDHAEQSNAELRELAHGILPAALTIGGLRGALGAVLERLDLPVDADVLSARLPPEIEASAYFIAAEALTNVAKHARAEHATVRVFAEGNALRIEVRDDGVGGADPGGHGLVGLADRAAALGGRLEVASPESGGTLVCATLPLAPAAVAD